ncbi:MAG: hypothetical protein ACOYXM_17755 [Actinomycetota bacterium]
MLYLLKGSRVREYHQQNVAILSAPEGEHVEIAYNHRWVQDGLRPQPDDGCVLVFADSPYEHFVPVRFAALTSVEETDSRLNLTCRLGPFIRVGAHGALSERWTAPELDVRPGRKVFVFEDENPGLLAPRSMDEADEGWRAAVDALSTNGFFERTTIARILDVTDETGLQVDHNHPVPLGSTVRARVELRSPSLGSETVEAILDADPRDSVVLVGPTHLPANGVDTIELTVSTPGVLSVGIALRPDPLLSSRPSFTILATDTEQATSSPPIVRGGHVDAAAIRALVARLRRDTDIDDSTWLGLYQDVFLGWAPDDPVLLAAYARHAYATNAYDICHDALAAIDQRFPDDDYLFLLASLRSRRTHDLSSLIQRIDLKEEDRFEQFLDALEGVTQPTLQELLHLLPNQLLGEDKTIRFLDRAWKLVEDVNVACKIAEDTAYADPERGSSLLLDRWPDAERMPPRALELVLDWEARRSRLTPYIEVAIKRTAAAQEWEALLSLTDKARRILKPTDRMRLLAWAGQQLMLAGPGRSDQGFALVCEATHEAAQLAELDLAAEYASAAAAHARLHPSADRLQAAASLKEAVDAAIADSAQFQRWQQLQEENEIARLAPSYRGKVLHVVGGKAREWHDQLRENLELSDLRWHESSKDKSANIDWADGMQSERDVVLVITDQIGHDTTTPLRLKCAAKRVPYLHASSRLRDVLAALSSQGGNG